MRQQSSRNDEKSFYQAYRQYIEFMNQTRITSPFSNILLAMSNVILLCDLISNLDPNNTFLQEISFIGISTAIVQIISLSSDFLYLITSVMFILLLCPLFILLSILFANFTGSQAYNGQYKKKFQKSFLHEIFRMFINTFPYLCLPLMTSIAIQFTKMNTTEAVIGSFVLVLACVDCFIIEYHTFDFMDYQEDNILIPTNYPYRFIDDMLVIFAIIFVNVTQITVSLIIGFVCICLRLILSQYMPFYKGKNQKKHQTIQASSLIFAFGLIIAQFQKQYILFIVIIIVLIAILGYSRMKQENQVAEWEQIVLRQPQEFESLVSLRKRLFKKGLFVRSFKQLIIISRRNNSHRNQLEIQILKSKCINFEMINRGGVRVCSSEDVMNFEQLVIRFLDNFLNSSELCISILKFMQHREGRKEVLGKAIERLVKMLQQNKTIIKKMFELNQSSSQAKFLLCKTYGEFYQDSIFLKEIEKWTIESMGLIVQKQLKERLYSDKTSVIVINILQEIGKIVKISKNLPGVLGFQPPNLIGLSINELIPFSVKPHHDQMLTHFIQNFSNRSNAVNKNFNLQFYAYNNLFHLQDTIIRYNWIMTDFDSFKMAGVIEKIQNEANVILVDQFGFIQGWTSKIGGEQFNLDELSIGQRKNFNILPLFPTLIKYLDSLGVCTKTLFFKNTKARDPRLMVLPRSKHENLLSFQQSLMQIFKKMLKEEDLVAACFAEIQFEKLSLCRGKANMRRIIIKNYERIENFSEISTLIQSFSTKSVSKTQKDKTMVELSELGEGSQKQQQSIFSEDEKTDKKLDSNFTLDPQGIHLFPVQQLVFSQFHTNNSKTAFQLTGVYQPQNKKAQISEEKSTAPQNNFNPTLQRHITLFWYVLAVTAAVLTLVIFNITSVTNTSFLMNTECDGVVKRNRATMIYLKSIFNPNATYIGQFINGKLLQNEDYLFSQYINYTNFLGNVVQQNKYYLFNTQIPATLQRLLKNPIQYSNSTVNIIPATSKFYYNEISSNYVQIVKEYDSKFSDALSVWSQKIGSIRSQFYVRLGFLCLATLLYTFLLILLYVRQRKHTQTLEAFFKFEKEDLEKKITVIGQLVKEVQAQVSQWHLLKNFSEIVKKNDLSNFELALIKNTYEVKIKFDYDQQTEKKIEKKKYYIALIVIALFLSVQLVFIILHATINLNALSYYETTPYQLDQSAKLIVYPNYLLAGLYLPLPANIENNYYNTVTSVLSYPITSIYNLYNMLSTPPCLDCTFMYPVLTTNYKSFYSTFEQRVIEMNSSKSLNNTVVQDLFYAADYVANNILEVLTTQQYNYVQTSLVAYFISMIILCAAIQFGSSSVNEQIEKQEIFLKFFSQQTITKNKHMNRLFSNTS